MALLRLHLHGTVPRYVAFVRVVRVQSRSFNEDVAGSGTFSAPTPRPKALLLRGSITKGDSDAPDRQNEKD
jgi:hypothetical protein